MKDKFNREIDYIRVSVTDNCNLRCVYCMNENEKSFLKENEKLTDEEIIRIIRQCASLGVKKVRITGGEPLTRKGIVALLGRINSIDGIKEIYLTTNGILLGDKIEELISKGLKGVNISLDSLKEDKFKSLTRGGDLNKVLQVINKAIELGIKVKLNTVIINNYNKDEILDFVKLTINNKVDVRFIELMPMGAAKIYKGISNDEVLAIIKNNYDKYDVLSKVDRDGPSTYIRIKEAKGKIGFISAISNCFCKECNRIRLTADGVIKQCLHYDYGVNLKNVLADGISDSELKDIIYNSIYDKPEKHLFLESSKHKEIRFMNQIGG